MAILQTIQEHGELSLEALSHAIAELWQDRLDTPEWVSTFLAPNMMWLRDWEDLKREGKLATDSHIPGLIRRRLAYEVYTEFGMQSGIGRSLLRTGTAGVAINQGLLHQAVDQLLEPLQNEVPGLRDLTAQTLEHFLLGLLFHLRTRGGVLDGALPIRYLETGGKDVHAFKRDHALPAYGKSSRLPEFLTNKSRTSRFETWGSKGAGNWYNRWVARGLATGGTFNADPASTYPLVMSALVQSGLVKELVGDKEESLWGVSDQALSVSSGASRIQCHTCGHATYVATSELELWRGSLCVTARCDGSYQADTTQENEYFSRLYSGGDLERIFTEEHTGLLKRVEREKVEEEFKSMPGLPDDPQARKPWYPNLLSCTPTLEMGIDIGDLSTTILCSVPPTQSNYLQRIGRAGRKDGNALVLAVATAKPHDLYFYAEPAEMFAGEVTPPGVFLNAPEVLKRQLTAFCFDRWVAAHGDAAELPPQIRTVFSHLNDESNTQFPFTLLKFIEDQKPILLREFCEMFADTISDETSENLKDFLVGTEEGQAGLRWHILETIERERRQRDSLSAKARSLREEIKKLNARENKSEHHDEDIDKLEQEKEALLELVSEINKRSTLEFLTEQGLLPNYAFPEAAVSLKSVIWRKKKNPEANKSKYETKSIEYKRSPSSALSDLAPHADFYAGGHKVRIDQIDIGVTKPEDWRFCSECNHAQCIEVGDDLTACPACNAGSWVDDGQKFRLMKLQQVFANAPDRESRIRDDKEDRQPRFFQRQVTVSIKDEDRGGAWHVDNDRTPFGFEFISRATFREVNFGEPLDQGASSVIAGREAVRPGFHICAKCGMVQEPNKDPVHAFSCPSRKKGAKQVLEDCLYLYREFQSEALRLLLPMADLGTESQLHSFVAALQVGLKERFSGSVDHLKTTVYSEPVEGSALRKQYLVLFDTVPGGTGYLKQVVTPGTEGERIPLYEIFELALEKIESCRCWNEPLKDGCYRCLYAYRNARDMDDTSSTVASDLLRRLLAGEDSVEEIESLGDISITGLMDSVLEARFVEALRLIHGEDGQPAKLKPALVNQKPGYRWKLGELEWSVEPQVEPNPSESGGVPVSIDFVMRPAKANSTRKLAIFLDGWAYHKDRVGKDLQQRMALIASGNWDVWSFTWADLDVKFGLESNEEPLELGIPDQANLKAYLQRMGLSDYAALGGQSVFDWFELEIKSNGLPWDKVSSAVLAARMQRAQFEDSDLWKQFIKSRAPVVARQQLAGISPRMISKDIRETNPHFELMAVHDGESPALLCYLHDNVDLYEVPEYKAAWRGYLRLYQVLRHCPNAWFVTQTAVSEDRDYSFMTIADRVAHEDSLWDNFDEIEPDFRSLAHKIMAAEVDQPDVAHDIPDTRNDAWAEAELIWFERKVALTSRELAQDAAGEPASSWRIFYLEDLDGDISGLVAALRESENS
jgi:DEAD/DEAH box helicase domain-containing protein